MARYSETTSPLGSRIMSYRKIHSLTQSDLADRYGVSGPAIFKFEKGFVTPSLKLWQKIASNIDIPEGGVNNSVYCENTFDVIDVTLL